MTAKKCVPVNRNLNVKHTVIGKFLLNLYFLGLTRSKSIHNSIQQKSTKNRYNPITRDNCLLCDRPFTHLDIYADVEPDRDFDIYSMSDDPQVCKAENYPTKDVNARKAIK